MRFIFSCGLLLALAACRSDRVPAQDAEKNSSASVVTPTTTPEDAAAGLKRDPDGELHMADWSVTDSQIGAVMRIGKQRRPSQNDDFAVTTSSLEVAPGIRVGCSQDSVRALLGRPTHERVVGDTTILEYASPFIGPDESVEFHIVGGTVRQIAWIFFPG